MVLDKLLLFIVVSLLYSYLIRCLSLALNLNYKHFK
jgi:hypothetical protein